MSKSVKRIKEGKGEELNREAIWGKGKKRREVPKLNREVIRLRNLYLI